MSFILNGLVYDKPMFSIVAYNRAQLATAFEQMEKLRKSGHLAGYVRREAFLQQETSLDPETEEQPMALLKFTLYRLQKKAPEPQQRPWVFCPSLLGVEDGYIKVATNCPGSFIHDTLAPDFSCSAHFEDAFESLVFMGREEQNLAADNTTPVRDLLFEALGNASVLMGHFSPKGISLCPSTLALHKKAREEARDLLVRDADREEIVKRLCQPAFPIRTATRLEGGRALLLERHLARLIRLASEHAIPTDRLESLARAVSSVELPLPGSEALWSGGLPCPWGMLPASVEEELLKAGVDIQKRAALHMELQKDGSVLFAALPLAEDGTRTCGVCRTCLDERSDAWQLDTTKALQEQDTIQERVQAGEIDDAIIVNRCAAVAGTGHGALLCKQGPALFCPPARERARDSVCLDFLLERSLVQERLCGLAKALSSQELFRANSLHGLEKLVVVKD